MQLQRTNPFAFFRLTESEADDPSTSIADLPDVSPHLPNKHLENLSRFLEETEAEMDENSGTVKSTESHLMAKYFENVRELASRKKPNNLVSTPVTQKPGSQMGNRKLDVVYETSAEHSDSRALRFETAINTSPSFPTTARAGSLTSWKTDIPATPDGPPTPGLIISPCTPSYRSNVSMKFEFGTPRREIVLSPILERKAFIFEEYD